LELWNAGVHLLFTGIRSSLLERFSDTAVEIRMREYDQLSIDDFIDLCEGRQVRLSWAFTIRCDAPGMPAVERLAWAGVMGSTLKSQVSDERPVLMWSEPNPNGYPPWSRVSNNPPGGEQMTIHKDRWLVVDQGRVIEYAPTELAEKIAEDISELTIPTAAL
ncbi:MAG TPA: hypothetical protein VLE27_11165, partial [Thermoanaerobaculia bacterium]|nr:hypothetical protein [Thermoanaerobaculia bacterium]